MCVYHMDYQEWNVQLEACKHPVLSRVVVIDGIAGLIYYFYDLNKDLCYLDEFFPSELKKEEFKKLSKFDVHKQLYRKLQLDQYQRIHNYFC